MKTIIKIMLFSALALIGTSYWNMGFILRSDLISFLYATCAIAATYYLIAPILKLILLPLNIVTFGLASFIIILFILHTLSAGFNVFEIKSWNLSQSNIFGMFRFPSFYISYIFNLILSSVSISGIINILKHIS